MIARLVYSALGPFRWASHLNVAAEIERWIRRARLDVEYSHGFNPRPRISFGPAKPVGMAGLLEIADVVLETAAPLEDPEFLLEFPGAKDGAVDPETLEFRYPGQIAPERSWSYPPYRGPNTGTPEWWLEPCRVADMQIGIFSREGMDEIANRLSARSSPSILPALVRLLPANEPAPTKKVQSTLIYSRIEFETGGDRYKAVSLLRGDSWVVETGPTRIERDVRPFAAELSVLEDTAGISVFVRALSSESGSLPFMRVVEKLAVFGGAPIECVRVLFLDADGLPVL